MWLKGLLIILLLLGISGCAMESAYPDAGRIQTMPGSMEVMQGLENTVEDILEAQKAANSDLRELKQLTISTRQYYGNSSNNSAYTDAKIELLTEEDMAFVRDTLIAQGFLSEQAQDAQAWTEALANYQAKKGLSISGRPDAATVNHMQGEMGKK